jgi:hypothetical protein
MKTPLIAESMREQSPASPHNHSLWGRDSKSPEATHPGSIPGPGSNDLAAVEHHRSRIYSRNCFRNAPDFEGGALYARTARVIGGTALHGAHLVSGSASRWAKFPALFYLAGALRRRPDRLRLNCVGGMHEHRT